METAIKEDIRTILMLNIDEAIAYLEKRRENLEGQLKSVNTFLDFLTTRKEHIERD